MNMYFVTDLYRSFATINARKCPALPRDINDDVYGDKYLREI